MLRRVVPAVLCATLTVAAITIELIPALAALFILLLVVSPAVTAWLATRGSDALTYLAAGMAAAGAVAVVGGIVNETRSDDYTLGIVFLGTLLVGLLFTLPLVLVA